MTTTCSTPIAFDTLLAYWLDELADRQGFDVEEHFLGCEECATRLQVLADLGDEVRFLARTGGVPAIVSESFVSRLAADGVRLREYSVPRNGSVQCTIAPDDDLVVARLEGPFDGAAQLDLVQVGGDGMSEDEGPARLRDVPYDPATRSIVVASRTELVRGLPSTTIRWQIVSVEADADRVLGEYTLIHSRWAEG